MDQVHVHAHAGPRIPHNNNHGGHHDTTAQDTTQDRDELRGVLFKNDRKEKDTQPDYKGEATVKGQRYWLAA